jgi:hypothetical protein
MYLITSKREKLNIFINSSREITTEKYGIQMMMITIALEFSRRGNRVLGQGKPQRAVVRIRCGGGRQKRI